MDLSLSNDLDESFLTDWGDGANKVEMPTGNVGNGNREIGMNSKKEGNERLGESTMQKDVSSEMKNISDKTNLVQNLNQSGGHQLSSYITSLMDGNNASMNIPQSQPFWQSVAINQGNGNSNSSDGVALVGTNVAQNIPTLHSSTLQWNQQGQKIQKLNNETSNNENKIVQHTGHHILKQSQQGNTQLTRNLWQSTDMKGAQSQPQQVQTTQNQQSQQGQAIHQVLYQNAALAMMKGNQNASKSNRAAINNPNVVKNVPPPQKQPKNINATTTSNIQQPQQTHPPFHLFGAPCELRYNFIQSQKKHDLPIWQDNNSYHYGMAINGFHPQLNAMENPPVLIDARHVNDKGNGKGDDASQQAKSCKERNEKEQRRAQKISDLIDQLRESMVAGGWKNEMKSKYQTLSTCKEYVKHLIKATKDKEQAVEKAKNDLETKQKQMEEEKLASERSDPESVMSSLTSSSRCNSSVSVEDKDNQESRKRKKPDQDVTKVCKARLEFDKEKNDSTSGDSSEEEINRSSVTGSDRESPTSSTDKSTSSNGSEDEKGTEQDLNKAVDSDASVKLKPDDLNSRSPSAVISNVPKSMEKFKLDYEQVFMTSNVPQVIASSSGRIMKCNHIFLKAIGLSRKEVQFLTIFSIVQADQLSYLFETIGNALRHVSSVSTDNSDQDISSSDNEEKRDETEKQSFDKTSSFQNCRLPLLTLPCSQFPTKIRRGQSSKVDSSLNKFFMTISLFNDQDPQKCLFHCLLNNFSDSERSAGYVTPKLVDALSQDSSSVLPKKPKTPVY